MRRHHRRSLDRRRPACAGRTDRVGPSRRSRAAGHLGGSRARHDARRRRHGDRSGRDAARHLRRRAAAQAYRGHPAEPAADSLAATAQSPAARQPTRPRRRDRYRAGRSRQRGLAAAAGRRIRRPRRMVAASRRADGRVRLPARRARRIRCPWRSDRHCRRGTTRVLGRAGLDAPGHDRRPAVRRWRCRIDRLGRSDRPRRGRHCIPDHPHGIRNRHAGTGFRWCPGVPFVAPDDVGRAGPGSRRGARSRHAGGRHPSRRSRPRRPRCPFHAPGTTTRGLRGIDAHRAHTVRRALTLSEEAR